MHPSVVHVEVNDRDLNKAFPDRNGSPMGADYRLRLDGGNYELARIWPAELVFRSGLRDRSGRHADRCSSAATESRFFPEA